jgi:hypothetical protein
VILQHHRGAGNRGRHRGGVIFAPPASFGTRSSMTPFCRSRFRVPSLKLKMVWAPRRARVASVNVSSARDSTPVRTAVPSRTSSLMTAGRAVPAFGRSFTSRTIWVTRASFNRAAWVTEIAAKKKQHGRQNARAISRAVRQGGNHN